MKRDKNERLEDTKYRYVFICTFIFFPDRGNRIDEAEAVSEENVPEKKKVWSLQIKMTKLMESNS